jgi:hypothetical protein
MSHKGLVDILRYFSGLSSTPMKLHVFLCTSRFSIIISHSYSALKGLRVLVFDLEYTNPTIDNVFGVGWRIISMQGRMPNFMNAHKFKRELKQFFSSRLKIFLELSMQSSCSRELIRDLQRQLIMWMHESSQKGTQNPITNPPFRAKPSERIPNEKIVIRQERHIHNIFKSNGTQKLI